MALSECSLLGLARAWATGAGPPHRPRLYFYLSRASRALVVSRPPGEGVTIGVRPRLTLRPRVFALSRDRARPRNLYPRYHGAAGASPCLGARRHARRAPLVSTLAVATLSLGPPCRSLSCRSSPWRVALGPRAHGGIRGPQCRCWCVNLAQGIFSTRFVGPCESTDACRARMGSK